MYTFRVTPEDGEPFEVASTSRDILAWERKSGKTARYILEKLPYAELYKIAHLAATRQGLYDGDFAAFQSGCDLKILRTEDDDDASDPTLPGLITGR
jgi:hypothetical protein